MPFYNIAVLICILVFAIALAHILQWISDAFTRAHLEVLASFCKSQNGAFKRERWFEYIAGSCGPNGGAIKHAR